MQNEISVLNNRITIMQNGLLKQLQAADSFVALLQSQQTNLTTILTNQLAAINGTIPIPGH